MKSKFCRTGFYEDMTTAEKTLFEWVQKNLTDYDLGDPQLDVICEDLVRRADFKLMINIVRVLAERNR